MVFYTHSVGLPWDSRKYGQMLISSLQNSYQAWNTNCLFVKYAHERIHLFFMKLSEFGLWWNTKTTVNIPSSFLLTHKGAKASAVCSWKKCWLGIFRWSGHRRRAFTVYLENRGAPKKSNLWFRWRATNMFLQRCCGWNNTISKLWS